MLVALHAYFRRGRGNRLQPDQHDRAAHLSDSCRMDGELRDALRGRGIPRGQRPRPVLDRFDHLPWPVRHRGGRLRHHGSCNGQYAILGRRADVLLVYRVSGAERRAHSARPRQGVYLLVADLGDAQARGRVRACRRQVQLSVRVPGDFR